MTHVSAQFDWHALGEEAIERLRDLLRIDTRNPPGNETRVAEYLREILRREGIESEIVGPSSDRGSLVARLKGDGSAPPLLLMSHTDVVAVEPEKWTHDPFSGDIADDFIYGRGALDMKHMVAMELMTMLLLKRTGVPLKRDVIFLAAADEEVGGEQGAGWVAAHHPDLVRAEYALNEGGGVGFELNGQRYYTVQTAEKGVARFRLRATGKPGHGSVPHDENAILKLAATLDILRQRQTPVHFTTTLRKFLSGIAQGQPPEVARLTLAVLDDEATADTSIDDLPIEDELKRELHALVRNTVAPTMLQAGTQLNVIPSQADALFDARILPGWTPEMFLPELRALFGSEIEIEFVHISEPLEAEPDSPLFEVIRTVVGERDPGALVVPFLLTGGTDAKHMADLGVKVYGFAPELYLKGVNGMSGIHGHDERISTRSMRWGTRVLFDVVARFAGDNSIDQA